MQLGQLSGNVHKTVKSALLQDPGVGGRFCRIDGLRLGPTRLVGVSLAFTFVSRSFLILDLFVAFRGLSSALLLSDSAFHVLERFGFFLSIRHPRLVTFSRIGVLSNKFVPISALLFIFYQEYCLERSLLVAFRERGRPAWVLLISAVYFIPHFTVFGLPAL